MAELILILGVAPILAPSLGGLVLQFAGWRDIFWIMSGYGALGLVLSYAFLPDTLSHHNRVALHPRAMLRRYASILAEPAFLTHALVLSAVAFALFAYLGGMPTLFIEGFHLSPGQFGIVFGMVAASYILCTQLNVHLTRHLGLSRSLHVTTAIYLVLMGALVVIVLAHRHWPWVIGGLLMVGQGMTGFIGPTATVGALSRHSAHAGSASAVLGTMQFAIGSSSGFLLAWMSDGSALPMVGLMLVGAVGMKLADLCRPAVGVASPRLA